ncbi:zinc finger protein 648 [Oenanthe melanoleuca]|uniref:zinc finger protein 648 n=1 Tax=Oenanthe melanoleuca TaxID=2939378 RepID=UPI0024C1903D|nr:zinc finger protein 648 [Oenanthe melanoleuca]
MDVSDTGRKHSNYPRKASKQVAQSCSQQKEVEMDCSCSPPGSSAGPAGKQEQCGDKETCDTYCQKQGESPAGEFAPSSTSFPRQSEDEDADHCSRKPEARTTLRGDDRSAALEELQPVPEAALPYPCKKCGSCFRSAGELREHRRAHLLGRSYRCPTCAKGFSRAANLRMHRLIHSSRRPHRCPECDKGFIRTADVWRHLRNVHKIERSMVILAGGVARNPWSVEHRSQHGAECPDQPCPANPNAREDDFKPYACPTCGKGFDKPNLLSKHKVIHREDKPYKCQECGMAFVQLLRLKRHQQTHSGARPFYCEECGGTFTRLASLQRHHRIHTGEKPYSCNFCGHSFTESGTLRRHERTHKLDKP